MTFNLSEQQEKKYLQQVIGIINDTIQNTDTSVKEHVETLQEYKDYIWSNKDIDPHEIRSMRESILNHFALGESVIDKRRRLGKILDIPYFGRIDFEEKKKLKIGEVYEATIKRPRNLSFHRKYFGLINLAWEYQNEIAVEHFKHSIELFRKTVEMAAGWCEPIYSIARKEWIEVPKSIAFDKMDCSPLSSATLMRI